MSNKLPRPDKGMTQYLLKYQDIFTDQMVILLIQTVYCSMYFLIINTNREEHDDFLTYISTLEFEISFGWLVTLH